MDRTSLDGALSPQHPAPLALAHEASLQSQASSHSSGLADVRQLAGSKLQQLSNKFKLRKNKPASGLSIGSDASGSPPPAPILSLGRKASGEMTSRSASQQVAESSVSFHASDSGTGGFRIRKGASGIEEFNPKASHPTNPLAPIAPLFTKMMKPITVPSKALMARTFKGRSFDHAGGPGLPLSKFDGTPPMGYLWLWMGGFMRWRRRFLVASEAPGVVLIYKRMNMKGKVHSISLRNANIHADEQDLRQLKILTPAGLIFLRAADSMERDKWLHCLSQSISIYHEKQRFVEGLQQQGLLPPLNLGLSMSRRRLLPRLPPMPEGQSGAGGGSVGQAGPVLDAAGLQLLPTGEVADMDVEQRRRIRARVGEKLSEIAPYQAEVEAHMNQLSSQLLGVVSALNIRVGNLTPATSNVRLAHFLANSQAAPSAPTFARTSAPKQAPSQEGRDTAGSSDGEAGAAAAAGNGAEAVAGASGSVSAGSSPPASTTGPTAAAWSRGPEVLTPAAAAGSMPAEDGAQAWGAGPPGSSSAGAAYNFRPLGGSTLRTSRRGPASRPATLQQAYGNLLEAFRGILHGEAVRIAQLEAENQALQRTLKVVEARRLKNTRSNAGAAADAASSGALGRVSRKQRAAATAPSAGGADTLTPADEAQGQGQGQGQGVNRNTSSGLIRVSSNASSAMTADEDAFDVVEAFDEGVNYAILDEPGYGALQEGTPEVTRRMTQVRDQCHADDAAGGTTTEVEEGDDDECAGVGDEEEEGEGGDVDDDVVEEARKEAEVLQALEIVRQVHYVEQTQAHSAKGLALLATQSPPPLQSESATGCEDDEDSDDEEDEEVVAADGGSPLAGSAAAAGAEAPIGRISVQASRRRQRLPAAKPLGRGFSVWSVLKDMIGKDLTRITMPATINEPSTFLQRLAESFEYYSLLDEAAATADSTTRMMMVAVWQLSCYNSQPLREGKPFNPLLGETYEWQAHDGSVKYVCEQVSHHPPVSAFHARGGLPPSPPSSSQYVPPRWEVQGEYEVKTKFWGKSIELLMMGCEALRFPQHNNEEYRWNKATICVNDLIFGNFYADIYGKIKITNRMTGDLAVLNLKPCKGRKEKRGEFDGSVYDGKGKEVYKLYGSTMDKVYAVLTPAAAAARGGSIEPMLMWQKDPYPEDTEVQYNFTRFAIEMNDPSDPIVPYLPPTDARFRPDQRALEVGEFARATTEKLRLEEKQRQARRALAEAGQHYQPMWFRGPPGAPHPAGGRKPPAVCLTKCADEEGFVWAFREEYWKHREAKDWRSCPDLYS